MLHHIQEMLSSWRFINRVINIHHQTSHYYTVCTLITLCNWFSIKCLFLVPRESVTCVISRSLCRKPLGCIIFQHLFLETVRWDLAVVWCCRSWQIVMASSEFLFYQSHQQQQGAGRRKQEPTGARGLRELCQSPCSSTTIRLLWWIRRLIQILI